MAPSPRQPLDPDAARFADTLAEAWAHHPDRRAYVQVSSPLVRPGETLWFRVFDLQDATLSGEGGAPFVAELVNPRGAVVVRKRRPNLDGDGHNDFVIPAGAPGGRYVVRLTQGGASVVERPITVASFETPRVKKTLDFVRKAYGPADTVSATLELARATGEPLAERTVRAVVDLDGAELTRFDVPTDSQGAATVRFDLPADIARGDGLLTVLVEEAGVTESISRRVPIVLDKVDVQLFPEGGQLVEGIAGRVYLEARTPLGKPADVAGRVLGPGGQPVARFRTVHDGMGRFSLTPRAGETYRVVIDQPADIDQTFDVPAAAPEGCALRVYDDFDSTHAAIRAAVTCTEPRTLTVQAVLRDQRIDAATVAVAPLEPAVVYLATDDEVLARAQGVATVTVLDGATPILERLVYRHRGEDLDIEVTPAKEAVTPRSEVVLEVRTTRHGVPVPASLGLSVVDDRRLSLADDEEPHLLAQQYLLAELPGRVHEPRRYFDPKVAHAAEALDLLMGTRGWRRLAQLPAQWQAELTPPAHWARMQAERQQVEAERLGQSMLDEEQFRREGIPERRRRPRLRADAVAEDLAAPPPPPPAAPAEPAPAPAAGEDADPAPANEVAAPEAKPARLVVARPRDGIAADEAEEEVAEGVALRDQLGALGYVGGGRARARQARQAWATVRVFPVPPPDPDYEGPRTDFRSPVYFAPDLVTGADGRAEVRFTASDAITSFRVVTEGTGGGALGRDETVFASKLPFSMDVKLPVAVSAGDTLEVPLTLTSEVDRPLEITVDAEFGEGLRAEWPEGPVVLAPGGQQTRWIPLAVTGQGGSAEVSFTARGSGQHDAFTRTLQIEPPGFPQAWEAARDLSGTARWTVDLGDAVPGTVQAAVRLYPSPLSTLLEGMEGLLREPVGCFEQTSSSNYPNVMVLSYLQEHEVAAPEVLARTSGLLERGYAKLTGYETTERGYEWFGGAPAHEALTAYGLVEFVDMQRVFGGVDAAMIDRTRDYLLSRRDGKGGYQRNARALDSFGRAAPAVTDAYITWSLTEAGTTSDLDAELARSRSLARETDDPYLLALAAGTLLNLADPADGVRAAKRLAGLQADDGTFPGADHSITRSGGHSLTVETTSLAVLALLDAGERGAAVRRAVQWLQANRGGYGSFGSTQATVLALKALTAYASASRATERSGVVIVRVGGQKVASVAYEAGHQGAVELTTLGDFLQPGENVLEVSHDGDALPLSVAVDYRSALPATSSEAVVGLQTSLSRAEVPMGERVRLVATVRNLTSEGQPMALARVGLPGGVAPQGWQLEELRESGVVDFYETGPREVVLYFRDLAPEEVHEVPLELVAEVPGTYEAPASQAYLYYTDEHRTWVAGTRLAVTR